MKKLLVFLASIICWHIFTSPVAAQSAPVSGTSAVLNLNKEVKKDIRVKRIKNFLLKYNSPITDYAQSIVSLADQYQIDYRLVVAISGVESTFCKAIPYNSYNCWGWKNGNHSFQSYPDALEIVSRTLGKNYYKKGFDTPETIAPIYAPPSSAWAGNVRFFMNLLEDDAPSAFLAKQFSI